MKNKFILFFWLFAFIVNGIHAQTVYITETGKKYHAADCRYLSSSKIAIQLADALDRGYDACKVCKPTTKVSSSSSSDSSKPLPVKKSTPSNTSGERVGCICNDGTQSSATGRGACSHHGGVNHWLYK